MNFWVALLQLTTLCFAIYYYFRRKFTYWSSRGVPGPAPSFPFGNLLDFGRYGQVRLEKEWPAEYGPVYGMYAGTNPILTLTDPELIKQVLIKDFHLFLNRDRLNLQHTIWKNNIFSAEGEQWKRIRTITSPSFSSSKLKGMHYLMSLCVDKLVAHLRHLSTQPGNVNIKKAISGYTLDTIFSSAFGTETNVNGSSGTKGSALLLYAMKLMSISSIQMTTFLAFPTKLNTLLGNPIALNMKAFTFFVNLSREILKQRKAPREGTAKRNDLFQLMMDAFAYEDDLKGQNYEKLTSDEGTAEPALPQSSLTSSTAGKVGQTKNRLTENELIAQCIVFTLAGFETTSNTLSMILYYLALNPSVQERLYGELEATLGSLSLGSDDYFDTVMMGLPYLDAIVKETLRLSPPLPRLQRRCSVDGYTLGGISLEKNMRIDIAVYSVHHSEKYYADPETFNPERFMPENRHLLVPGTFLAFGDGPRNCIGTRFALQEIRLSLARMIRQFRFVATPQTRQPLKVTKIFLLASKKIPLQVRQR